jgi:cytochrome c oxidase subunit 3
MDKAIQTLPPPVRKPVVSNGVMGMVVAVLTELMFFAGLISAHMIAKSSAKMGIWPPPGQPRLPVEETLLNTAALLASGAAMVVGHKALKRGDDKQVKVAFTIALVLGIFFVAFQGLEWVGLLEEGLTMTSSVYGAFFYLVVGTHALHVTGALIGMVYVYGKLLKGLMTPSMYHTIELFWLFVVLIWPLIYWQVYL